uniref:DUF4198 domain-containing protein n=1 Tax=Desulfobacca acetoxidans TaxID=60893 RepID=A0A7V4G769_9BACT
MTTLRRRLKRNVGSVWWGAVGILMGAAGAQAHYLWALPEGDVLRLARGQPPAQFEAYEPAAVTELKAFDPQGRALAGERRDGPDHAALRVSPFPALVAVECRWGHRVETPEGKRFLTKKEAVGRGLKVLEAFTSTHFSKTLFAWGEAGAKPVGFKFEIVPEKNPLTLKAGEELPLRVLWQGAPLPRCRVRGLMVKDLLETDAQGLVRLKLPEKGLMLVYAVHREPAVADPEVDYHQFMSFLSFTVP